MLVTAYHLVARTTTYHDPGADYYDRRHTERARRRAIQALGRGQSTGGFSEQSPFSDTAAHGGLVTARGRAGRR